MNDEFLPEKIDRLKSVFLNILYLKPEEERIVTPDLSKLNDLKDAINSIFDNDNCTGVVFTLNTDKPFFGIRINPAISPADILSILLTEDKVHLGKYRIEFDSKLFEIGLSAEELVALTVFEVSSMIESNEAIDNVRAAANLTLLKNDDIVNIRESINYAQLVIYALKDTLYKVSSFLFKQNDEDLLSNIAIQTCDLEDDIISAKEKILTSTTGISDTLRTSNTSVLQWMFIMIKNLRINSGIIADTLNDAKVFSGSRLEIEEINKTIKAINAVDDAIALKESGAPSIPLHKFFDNNHISSVNEISFFQTLRKNGLRAIEDDYYEFVMRIKNVSTEEDAMYILGGINSRLSILDDYIANTENLSDYEKQHWQEVAAKYRALREVLAKKKIWSKAQYGLFVDYNQLDKLDEE